MYVCLYVYSQDRFKRVDQLHRKIGICVFRKHGGEHRGGGEEARNIRVAGILAVKFCKHCAKISARAIP